MRWVTLRSFSEGGLASAGSAASVGGATALAVGLHTFVIPLQFIGAFFEGIMVQRVYIVQQKPLPDWLSDD